MSVNSVHEAANFLREGIREGKFAPGQRLIAREVADLTGGGVGSFREALVRLAGEGLVTLHPNRGAAVRKLDRDEVREIYIVLEALDSAAARRCAQRAGAGELNVGALESAAASLDHACRLGRVSAYHAARCSLMDLLRRQSGAARIGELAEAPSVQISKRENESQLTKDAIASSNEEMQGVISHILAGEGQKAERAMRAHVKRIGKLVLESMPVTARAR
ncbi:GntR family transcriptional regulator [Hyphococcus sp.]|jgi:DNA-binding GntR family transcriptional regulator|uniref:GntR family transcriptional regulator n=1 Tax=Hyphococcus sp. TaxID=2038636 RepID=UPI003D122B9E